MLKSDGEPHQTSGMSFALILMTVAMLIFFEEIPLI